MIDKLIFSEDRKVSLRRLAVAEVNRSLHYLLSKIQKIIGPKVLFRYPEILCKIFSVLTATCFEVS